MRVFVLTTGRSGSLTFARACTHIQNYSVGHESRWQLVGAARLDYAEQHIEVDNRLAWLLGPLDARYGDTAFYVHLIRERSAVAQSFCRRRLGYRGIIRAYSRGILARSETRLADCEDYYDTVNANIRLFLRDKSRFMVFELAQADRDFPVFWQRIGAEGDFRAALQEWQVRHNALESEIENQNALARSSRKLKRIAIQLPDFLRSA